jgi:hypothetical protein
MIIIFLLLLFQRNLLSRRVGVCTMAVGKTNGRLFINKLTFCYWCTKIYVGDITAAIFGVCLHARACMPPFQQRL